MLAYYVEWHMRDALRELIFDDEEIEAAQATRKSVVAKAQRSKSAKQKHATLRTPEDLPVQSFQDLLKIRVGSCSVRLSLWVAGDARVKADGQSKRSTWLGPPD